MPLVFQSQAMLQLLEQARRLARSRASVLITGESGVGKELLARCLHDDSPRRTGPYIPINCAALPEALVESELFGHEPGAFTGAAARRVGRFEAAAGGTLFLDEVGELPRAIQPKLLRVLEDGDFSRLGSHELRCSDARIVAATNRHLEREATTGGFRLDLLHRLSVLTLHVPPLRERAEDIPLLATHFLERFAGEGDARPKRFSAAAIRALAQADWPGNVRQLRNVVRRACVLATGETIDAVDLPDTASASHPGAPLPGDLLKLTLREIERRAILAQLDRCAGNRSRAARTLGVTTRTLRNKVAEYRQLGYAC